MQRLNKNGFTLVELIVTLLIAAISLTLGVPSFIQFVNKNELSSASAEIVNTLQDARERAVRLDSQVTVGQTSQEVTCTYNENDTSFDCDGMDLSGSEVSITRGDSNDAGDIIFESSGMATTDLTLTVSHENVSSRQYEVRVLRSGRISLKQISN